MWFDLLISQQPTKGHSSIDNGPALKIQHVDGHQHWNSSILLFHPCCIFHKKINQSHDKYLIGHSLASSKCRNKRNDR